jgi:CheY-like chemotaxis protein
MQFDEQLNQLKGRKILVIDDEPDNLEVVQILLEMNDVDVITATNGQEGLIEARKHHPIFIISDLSMPDTSGWEMLEALKQDSAIMDIPVIALTAHAMEGDRSRAIAAGFHNYLTKPLRPDTFINDLLQVVMDIPAMGLIAPTEPGESNHDGDK